jgi:hypothetical protein
MVAGGIIAIKVRNSKRQGDISSYLVTQPPEHPSNAIGNNPLQESI